MHSIRTTITAIAIVLILTSILSVFAASYVIIVNETDKNSVRMMNLIDQDTQKTLEKYFDGIAQSVEVAANIAIEDLDSVFLVECGVIRTGEEEEEQTPEQTAALNSYLSDYCDEIRKFFSGVADYTQGVSRNRWMRPDLIPLWDLMPPGMRRQQSLAVRPGLALTYTVTNGYAPISCPFINPECSSG